jgi:hypothetical protein
MLLCDFAEAMNGKLYIMGGGWTDLHGDSPVTCAVAIRLDVPWDQANQQHSLSVELHGEDGEPQSDPEGTPIQLVGKFVTGRPPGAVPGAPLANPLAFRFESMTLESGGYYVALMVDGTELARASFRVHRTTEELT